MSTDGLQMEYILLNFYYSLYYYSVWRLVGGRYDLGMIIEDG